MLAEERLARIAAAVERCGTASIAELAAEVGVSESTVRRDLDRLDEAHRLVKVRGGAAAREVAHLTRDLTLGERRGLHAAEKRAICERAAGLVGPDDFVYLDAGSTIAELAGLLAGAGAGATFATDSVTTAARLAERGCRVIVLGGELKGATGAAVGPDACAQLERYRFTLGFFGANAVSLEAGCTVPEADEAAVKRLALARSARRYVLADASKLGRVSRVSFAAFDDATLITCGDVPAAYRARENVHVVGALGVPARS